MPNKQPSLNTPEPGGNGKPNAEWLTRSRFAALLGLLVFAAFPGIILGTQTFVFRDYGLFSYPVAFFQRQCFWNGELPLWNPLSECGLPFLAQWNTLALYPPSLFYLLLPLTWTLPVFCLVHLYWAGLGMFFLAEQWTGHRLGSAIAAVIFAFNGLSMSFLMWPSHIATLGWLPWVWLLGPGAWRHGGQKLVWAAVAAALQMLAGGPETILTTWLILIVLAAKDWIEREAPRNQVMVRLAGLTALVALLCAAQILPFLQLLFNSQRHTGYGGTGWSMPPWGWANFLVPMFRTSPTPQGVFLQNGQGWTSSYYCSVATVLLAIVAIRRIRTWPVRAFGVIVAACLLLVLGDSGVLYPILRACFPPLGLMRFPIKFVIPILALLPLLAAFGVQQLVGSDSTEASSTAGERPQARHAVKSVDWFAWTTAVILLGLIGIIVMFDRESSEDSRTLLNGLARAAFLIAILILLRPPGKPTGRNHFLIGCLLLLLFWLDFRTHVPSQNPTASPEIYTPGWAVAHISWNSKPTLGQSRALLGPQAKADLQFHALPKIEDTYLGHRLGLLADCNLLDGIPQVHGFFSLAPAKIEGVLTTIYDQYEQDFAPLLDFMGVSQITSSEKLLEWVARPNAMPLISAGQKPVFADDITVCSSFSNRTVNLRETVFVPVECTSLINTRTQQQAVVRDLAWANHHITFQIESAGPCLAVIAQTYYPAWRAFVDGEPARIWRANYAFQALELPAGRHSVRLVYQDRLLWVGLFLSLLGLVILVVLWLIARRPQHH